MKKHIFYFLLFIVLAGILAACNREVAIINSGVIKRDLTVKLSNSCHAPLKNNKILETDKVTDSIFTPDMDLIFSKADEIVRAKVNDIEYTSYSGLAWTKADILIVESFKGQLKEGDLVSIFICGGYMKLEDHIGYFNDGFRFENLTDEEIKNTILKENDNGRPFIEVGADLFFPLIKPAEHMPFPEGTYENLSVAGFLYIDEKGKFIQDYYEEGRKTTNKFTLEEVKDKMK